MYFDIINAEHISDYKINLFFEDGKSGIVDFKEYVKSGEVFLIFSDMEYFRKFHIEDGILTWGQGEVDIASETLYLKATGIKNIQWDIEELSKAI